MKRVFVVILLCSIAWVRPVQAGLARRINAIIQSDSRVTFGVRIVDVHTGRAVYEHNARKPLMPASNMKIVTSAAALHYLGAEFESLAAGTPCWAMPLRMRPWGGRRGGSLRIWRLC